MTGGANVPALNELLSTWGIAFGDVVLVRVLQKVELFVKKEKKE